MMGTVREERSESNHSLHGDLHGVASDSDSPEFTSAVTTQDPNVVGD